MKKHLVILSLLFVTVYSFSQKPVITGDKENFVPCKTTIGNVMFAPIDTTPSRNVADNYKTWENGEVIKVKFLNNGSGNPSIRQKIMRLAKEWEQYANIKFQFVPDTASVTNVRIRLGSKFDKIGHDSKLGTDCNYVSQFFQTMNLDTSAWFDVEYYANEFRAGGPFYRYLISKSVNLTNYTYADLQRDLILYPQTEKKYNETKIRRTVQHEFGHVLGLLHEQSYPGAIKWNKDTVYKYYAPDWNKQMVDFQVFQVSEQFFTNGTAYDPKSIMHYAVPAWQTLDGRSIDPSNYISEGDKKLIGALYPKNKIVSDLAVPKVTISNFTRLDVKGDVTRKGLVIRPAFDLKTGAVLANTYFVAYLTTEDGKFYISTANQQYNVNGNAAAYQKKILLPNSKISYNKGTNKLELFFPYSQMPDLNGKKVTVLFTIYLDDTLNGRIERINDVLSLPLVLNQTR